MVLGECQESIFVVIVVMVADDQQHSHTKENSQKND
jgi:hypothetical protein